MRPSSWLGRLAVMLLLAAGFQCVWSLSVGYVADWIGSPKDPAPVVIFLANGQALREFRDGQTQLVHYEDLEGRRVEVADNQQRLSTVTLPSSNWDGIVDGDPLDWQNRLDQFSDLRDQPTLWYLVTDGQSRGRAYLVGYSTGTNQRVGFAGTRGFRPDLPPTEEQFPFDGSAMALHFRVRSLQPHALIGFSYGYRLKGTTGSFPWWQVFVQGSDDRLYAIDLRRRTVEVLLADRKIVSFALYQPEATVDQPILPSGVVISRSAAGAGVALLVVRTADELLLFDHDYSLKRRYEIPTEARGSWFDWGEPTSGPSVLAEIGPQWPTRGKQILWFDEKGEVTRRADTAQPAKKPRGALAGLELPSPVLVAIDVCLIEPWEMLHNGSARDWHQAIGDSTAVRWPGLVVAALIALLLAIDCRRREVLHATGHAEGVVWPLLVLVGGLPVWIGHRFGQHWSGIEPCAHCGSSVPRDRERCARCRDEFPRPALVGTEILA